MNQVSAKEKLKNKFRDDPVAFAYVMCRLKPTKYQEEILRSEDKRIIVCAGRQIGKSTIIAIKVLWKAWCFDNQDIIVVGAVMRQAEIIYSKIYEMILNNPILKEDTIKFTQNKTMFSNLSVIRCLPAGITGDFIRGYTSDMIIVDEAQNVPDEVFISLMPSLMVKEGQLILLGTPSRGRTGFFWEAYNRDDWKKFKVSTLDSPFIRKEEIEAFRTAKGEIAYRREILAEFVDADDMFFDLGQVRKLATLRRQKQPQDDWLYYCGIDWARMGKDYNAIVMVGYNPDYDRYEMVDFWIRQKRPLNDVTDWAIEKIVRFKPRVIVADATSGWGTAVDMIREKLQLKNIEIPVREMNFAKTQLRRELYWNLKRMIDNDRILLIDDQQFLEQFEGYKYTQSMVGAENIKKTGANDDIVDALAMACWSITGGSEEWKIADFMNFDIFGTEHRNIMGV